MMTKMKIVFLNLVVTILGDQLKNPLVALSAVPLVNLSLSLPVNLSVVLSVSPPVNLSVAPLVGAKPSLNPL